MSEQKFEYIIVGGGTAGAITAARLARAGKKVALFEAGPSDEGQEGVLTLRDWQQMLETEWDYDYTIEPQPHSNGRIRHARGKVLGGCSSHNSCIAFVPPAYDMEIWEQRGATGWGPDGVRSAFEKLLANVHLETAPPVNDCGRAFVEAAQEAGYPLLDFTADWNFGRGVGYFALNKKGEIRQSSSVAYLHPLSQWGDELTIYTGIFVEKILLDENNCAIGVQTPAGPVYCSHEVIVACGAFDSPKLLLLSGIGPADHLAEVGVPLRVELPGVGENLLDHPESVVAWESSQPVPPDSTQYWEIGLFDFTRPDLPAPDLMFHFGTQVFDLQAQHYGYPTAAHGFSLTPNVARATSQGTVRLRSADPSAPPRIDFRYYTDHEGEDARVLVEGIKLARRIAEQPALRPWIARELFPGPAIQTDEEILAYALEVANTVYHPAGTCKMGAADDPTAVVDPHLRVRGVAGLRVADAAVFPTMIGINPNLTCMMIGERCAELVLSAECSE